MLTFSINGDDSVQILKVQKVIQENIQYFKKFNGANYQEAINKTFMIAVQNADPEYDALEPYIKNLARNVLKEQDKEISMDTVTEDGEVSYPYLKLVTYIDETSIFSDNEEIQRVFKELYLKYGEEFLKMKQMFRRDNEKFAKSETIKNDEIKNSIANLCLKYDAKNIYSALYDFFEQLPKYSRKIENSTLKIIELKEKDFDISEIIPDIPLITDEDNNYYGIDKLTLKMEKDPDTFKWDVISKTSCDILRIDISKLINYMYSQIYVPQGVFTKHIEWCDDVYKLTTPGGQSFVNLDREKFMTQVKVELLGFLSYNRFNTIIAISPDYVYIKPTRTMRYDTIRLILDCGKIIDLPIEVYLKKRKI